MKIHIPFLAFLLVNITFNGAFADPIRVLFLGHESKHHNSNEYYPMLSKALGRDAIYFDYVTSVGAALDDTSYLGKFDALLIYANHPRLTAKQWKNLQSYVRNGGGFVPVHCASWCFANIPEFDQLVGGRFKSHQGADFTARIVKKDHPALTGVKEFEAWDETYFHHRHNEKGRTVLMTRDAMPGDPHTKPEPWTWIRTEGKGRVFYTASGHDERVWNHPDFHQLIKSGILWAVGDKAKARYEKFLASRAPLKYEKRDNVPNYERRPEPLPYQLPLSPEESMKYTQVPVGFRLELFASEPEIINPIYFQWDERGRLWVVESVDYPNELKPGRKGNDRIKICEDTNGDGKADKFTVFADGFNIPTSMVFARGGVILAHAPEFLFLKDTDGDDKADKREVLFTGFGVGDTHAGPSNLRYGFDNWIYGTVGYSRFNGEVNGKKHNFGMGTFRFRSDGSDMEFLHQFNNNTWGIGFNEAGDVFGSTANNNPSFFGGIPNSVFGGQRRMSAKMIASSPKFHPITPNIRQVDAFNAYTAGCGHSFATSTGFPKSWRDRRAFVCGPTGNLLGMYDVRPKESGYESVNAFSFVASADEWFSPIVAEVGPDGNMWIADWYNFIIQHNPTPSRGRGGYDAKSGTGNAHVNPNRDRQHGRIFRVAYEKNDGGKIPSLSKAKVPFLVQTLDSDNQFWRLTAQRLLVDGKKKEAVPALRSRIAKGGLGAVHALWTLQGLGALDPETHRAALIHPDAILRRNAIRALGSDAQATQLLFDSATLADKNLQTRLAAFVKLAEQEDSKTAAKTATLLKAKPENAKDEWLRLALDAAGAGAMNVVRYETGENLISNGSFEKGLEGWSFRNYSGPADAVVRQIEKEKPKVKKGAQSLRFGTPAGNDTSLFTNVNLKSGAKYRLSAWIRTEGVSGAHGALLNVHELQHEGKTNALQKTNDWKEVEKKFTANRSGSFTINCLFGGWGKSKGTAWFDEISLREIKPVYAENKSPEGVVGKVEAGRKIFQEHLVAGCVRCHALGGKGGNVGPALDGLASRKERDYVYRSLVNPSAELAEGFDKLGASPMPPMNILLNDQEIAHVMAFLMSLK
ncbi:MAG: ThuA domain-containing protein [Verrucomicrobia bacterium]|nr:ThuA domain-containing protein [Verrucomicrobiota bacterium]MDA0725101.1 ThuA domain-containing protein [Verrucomicrobiota bacterium]MDA1046177.1 ThuA domain-containing protein [Verrucomicrobiota bacterium]